MENGFKLHGTVELVQNEKIISDSFRKRDVIINTGGDYPQSIQVQFVNDMVDESGLLVQGMEVSIDINLRGRAWQNPKTNDVMYFNTLQGWKIETLQASNATHPDVVPKMNGDMANEFNEAQQSGLKDMEIDNNGDDLPF